MIKDIFSLKKSLIFLAIFLVWMVQTGFLASQDYLTVFAGRDLTLIIAPPDNPINKDTISSVSLTATLSGSCLSQRVYFSYTLNRAAFETFIEVITTPAGSSTAVYPQFQLPSTGDYNFIARCYQVDANFQNEDPNRQDAKQVSVVSSNPVTQSPAPINVSTTTASGFNLSWSSVQNASFYTITVAESSSSDNFNSVGIPLIFKTPDARTYSTVSGLKPATSYWVSISGCNNNPTTPCGPAAIKFPVTTRSSDTEGLCCPSGYNFNTATGECVSARNPNDTVDDLCKSNEYCDANSNTCKVSPTDGGDDEDTNGDSGGTDGNGTDSGGAGSALSVSSSSACFIGAGSTFFCQWDPRWKDLPSPGNCDLGSAGCGPTTTAMVLARFGDTVIPGGKWGSVIIPTDLANKPTDPPNIDKIFRQEGWRVCASNMNPDVFNWLKSDGMDYEVADVFLVGDKLDLNDAQKYISNGYLLILGASDFPNAARPGQTVDHILAASGVDIAGNRIRVFDPNNCNADGTEGPKIYIDNKEYDYTFAKAVRKRRS